MDDFLNVIYRRRSIRKFTEAPIDEDVLTEILKAGMAGPSAMNAQPWEFVAVTDESILQKFRKSLMFAKMNYKAVICVCGSPQVQKNKAGTRFWVQDCSAAAENILLAATALGLGSVWIGVYPIVLYTRQVRSILNIPEDVIPLGLIGLGYPAETKEARSQYEEKKVHWQLYASTPEKRIRLFKPRKNEEVLEETQEK